MKKIDYRKLTDETIASRAKQEKIWKQIYNFSNGKQWVTSDDVQIESDNKALYVINLIGKYLITQTNMIMDSSPTIRLTTLDIKELDEIKSINKYLNFMYIQSMYDEQAAAIRDSLLVNFGVIRIFIDTDGNLKIKRIKPFNVYKISNGIIYLDGDKVEIWTEKKIIKFDKSDTDGKITEEENKTGIVPFEILNFEYCEDYKDYGRSLTQDLISLQKKRNKLETLLMYHIGMVTEPPLLRTDDSDITKTELQAIEPGAVYTDNGLNNIRPMFEANSQNAVNQIKGLIQDTNIQFIEMTGITDQVMGYSGKRFSGAAMQQLLESANARTRARQRTLENYLKMFGRKLIEIIKVANSKIKYLDYENRKHTDIDFAKINKYEITVHAVSHKLMPPEQRVQVIQQFSQLIGPEAMTLLLASFLNDLIPESSEQVFEAIMADIHKKQEEIKKQKEQEALPKPPAVSPPPVQDEGQETAE
jgi:hypothetical protein